MVINFGLPHTRCVCCFQEMSWIRHEKISPFQRIHCVYTSLCLDSAFFRQLRQSFRHSIVSYKIYLIWNKAYCVSDDTYLTRWEDTTTHALNFVNRGQLCFMIYGKSSSKKRTIVWYTSYWRNFKGRGLRPRIMYIVISSFR